MQDTNLIVEIPPDCYPLEHQVAGHFCDQNNKTKICMLQTSDGCVLKAIQSRMNGKRELDFFKRIFCTNDGELDENEINLRRFLPNYRGYLTYNTITYIKMDDLASGLRKPTVIDLKIGRITHDPSATPEKISRHKIKYPCVQHVGFQITGMRVYNASTNDFNYYDKIFGRTRSADNMIECFAEFFQYHQKAQRNALRVTINRLEEIRDWFTRQTNYSFYSSSILIAYESDMEDLYDDSLYYENSQNDYSDLVRIAMIDFTHVVRNVATREIDNNYLFGLNNLINHLKSLFNAEYTQLDN